MSREHFTIAEESRESPSLSGPAVGVVTLDMYRRVVKWAICVDVCSARCNLSGNTPSHVVLLGLDLDPRRRPPSASTSISRQNRLLGRLAHLPAPPATRSRLPRVLCQTLVATVCATLRRLIRQAFLWAGSSPWLPGRGSQCMLPVAAQSVGGRPKSSRADALSIAGRAGGPRAWQLRSTIERSDTGLQHWAK